MTSILTNTAAMGAASALAATQRSLAQTQRQLSTGLRVASAEDAPATYAIATAMRTRIELLQAVDDGLSLVSAVIGVTSAALDSVRSDVADIETLVLAAQTAGVDKAALQQKIATDQKHIVATAEAASFNGVNWLVTRMTGTDVTREDVTEGGPASAYPYPPPGQYSDETKIVETRTTTQTLGSTSSGVTSATIINTYTPDATGTQTVFGASYTSTASGDPLDYRNVDVLFSPDGGTDVDLHPIEP